MPIYIKMKHYKTIHLLGIEVTRLTVAEFMEYVLGAAQEKKKTFITYLNAHCSNIAVKDAGYKNILNQADIVYADGQAIVWGSRFLGTPLPERVNAGDFFIEFCERCAQQGLSLYLLGSYQEVADSIKTQIQNHVPSLRIAGVHHGFFTAEEESRVIDDINTSGADIVLVGMSVPLQEKWVWAHRDEIRVPVVWCVGALFEYYAGHRHRAPLWMRKCGLEWVFRLALEPRRLWRRYIIGNPLFLYHLVQFKMKKKR